MLSALRVHQHLKKMLVRMLGVGQIETRSSLPLLMDMNVHHHCSKMIYACLYRRDRRPIVYAGWHPYKFAIKGIYRLFHPVLTLVERVQKGFVPGDSLYNKPSLLHMKKSVLRLISTPKHIQGSRHTHTKFGVGELRYLS